MCRYTREHIFKTIGAVDWVGGCWYSGQYQRTALENEELIKKQWASSYGVNVLPYDKIQRYVTDVDLRSAVQDNVAFKLSFGTTFAMAAFSEHSFLPIPALVT